MSNPLKELIDELSKPSNIKIGVVTKQSDTRSTVKISDGSYINVWGSYTKGSNVYIKDNQILGKIKKENITTVMID